MTCLPLLQRPPKSEVPDLVRATGNKLAAMPSSLSSAQRACDEDVPRTPESVAEGAISAAGGVGTFHVCHERLEGRGAQRIEHDNRDKQSHNQANRKERLQVDIDVREEAPIQEQGPDKATHSVKRNRRDTDGI